MAISGTPAGGNIAVTENDPPIQSTTAPPDAPQSGTTAMISTGDDRLVSAVYQYNSIFTASTTGNYCSTVDSTVTPPPGSCLLVLEVRTDQAGFPIQGPNWVVGGTGDYAFYPAIGLDLVGHAIVAFSRSNSGISPGAWVTGATWGSSSGWDPWSNLAPGTGTYDTKSGCGGQNRWGDYSGAAIDPTDPTDIWVAAEYSASSGTNNCLWGTVIARLTYSAPTVTSVTPQIGNAGTSTVITGTDFVASATTVYFGGNPASAVSVQTPNRLTATAPNGSGLVALRASTADGSSPAGAQFKYPRTEAPASVLPPRTSPLCRTGPPPRIPPASPGPRPLLSGSIPTPPLCGGASGWAVFGLNSIRPAGAPTRVTPSNVSLRPFELVSEFLAQLRRMF
jgi:hypothetical protein